MEKERLARDIYRLIIFIYVALIIYSAFSAWIPLLKPYRAIFTAALFIYTPLFMAERWGISPRTLGLTLNGWRCALTDVLKVSIWVFPLFSGAFLIYMGIFMGLHFHFALPDGIISAFIIHLFGVAFPEELFFRGFFQEMLNRVYRKRWHMFGCAFGPSVVITSFFFALGHLIFDPRPERLAVFFPALLFGILRERRGGLIASTFMHFFSNMLAFILGSWFVGPVR